MTVSPTTFEMSDHNAATQHNSSKSPLIRLPAELRAMIWSLCLSNVHVRLYGSIDDCPANIVHMQVSGLDGEFEFLLKYGIQGRDFPQFWNFLFRSDRPATKFWHYVSYDLAISCPGTHQGKTDFSCQLPQLWRVCKLLYNETYDVPFAAGNIFHFEEFSTALMLHECEPELMTRIKSLSLTRKHETALTEFLQTQTDGSPEVLTADEQFRQRKSNLRRLLPALVDVHIESRVAIWESAAKTYPLSTVVPDRIRTEKDRMSKAVKYWESLVARVMVEEAPQSVWDEMYVPSVKG